MMISRRVAALGLLVTACATPQRGASGPPLWVARRGAAAVYLFGSTPTPPESHWLTPSVERAFAASSDYWVENPEIDPGRAEALNQELGMNPERPLSQELGEADAARLRALLVRGGMAPDALEAQRPWLAYLTVSALAWGDSNAVLPERVLKERARAAGKSIGSEWHDTEELIRFSAGMPLRAQVQLVSGSLDDAEAPHDVAQDSAAWMAGDLRRFEERAATFRRRRPELYEAVNVGRNRRWAERVHDLLASGGTHFICIGLGHLIGPGSVVEQASSLGLQVERAA